MNPLPDLFIADTKEVVQQYRRLTLNLDPLGLDPLDTWMNAIVDSVGIEDEIEYQTGLLLYEMAGDFLYDDLPAGNQIVTAAGEMLSAIHAEFRRNGLYDTKGMLPWIYHSTTADHCIVLLYHDREDKDAVISGRGYPRF
jgi:hypothetical protein